MPRSILVVGATGNQGGAVINNLLQLEADFTILAVTLNAASPLSQKLTQKSSKIKVVQGDLEHPASLFENTRLVESEPVWGVYFVQNPFASNHTLEQELQQAKKFIDECMKHKVSFFVYGSVDRGGERSFNNRTPVPHFASKYDIEYYLAEKAPMANMNYTFLRPTGFMDNYKPGFQSKMFLTCWKIALKDKPLQLIAVSDIGYFAAQAFMDPQRYKGQAISLAVDELTFDQAAKIFEKATGQRIPLTFGFVASIVLFLLKGIVAMFQWMVEEGFGASVQELRESHPGMVDFATYLETESGYVSKGDK
ncbi:Ff.00g065580.m01.CDS01 [Fusarium sp. VM40]|nr:Ff.00g065580.m01.CDS01 [Fusarium sp. VM40]